MHRALKISLSLLLILPLLACGLLLALAASEGGSRLLAEQARRWSAGALEWGDMQGRLLGPLRLENLNIRSPGLELEVRALSLDWSPGALLVGRLDVASLEATGIRARLEASGTEPAEAPAWRPQDLPLPVDIRLGRLELSDLQWRSGDNPPQSIERVSLAASLENRQLGLTTLDVRAPQGFIEASGEVGFDEQLPLRLNLRWQWRLPDQRLAGGVLEAEGDAARLELRHTGGGELPVNLRGTVRDVLATPGWELQLDWPELPLDTSEAPLLVGPGWLRSDGTLAAYRLDSEGRLQGVGPDPLFWSLQAQGDRSGLQLAPLGLRTAPGELELRGAVGWSGPLTAALAYRAVGEQLTRYNPDLPPQLAAHGHLEGRYENDVVTLQRFDLALDQAPLQLSFEGRVALPATGGPDFEGKLAWRQLGWPLTAAAPAFASAEGRLQLAGTADDYRLDLAAVLAGSQLPPGHWEAMATGDRGKLLLQRLTGQVLDGEVTLAGELGWDPAPRWDLKLNGSGLDPGQWRPDLPGRLALALGSAGRVDPDAGLQGRVGLEQLSGVVAGRDVRLVANALLAGEALDLQSLQLDSGGNRLSASGRLAPAALGLGWDLQVPNPGALLPGLQGQLMGSGRLEGTADAPRVRVSLSGRELELDARRLSSLSVELEAGLAAQAPLRLDLAVGELAQGGETQLQSARLQARGSTSAHWLELDLAAPAQQLRARLEGGLHADTGQWRGSLAELVADAADYGSWSLAQPAPLMLSGAALRLGDTCLRAGTDSSRVCVQGDWSGSTGGELAARIQALALQRLVADLDGQLDGEVRGTLAADGALRGQGELELSAGQLRVAGGEGTRNINFRGGKLDFAVAEGGLDAALVVEGEQRRLLRAELQLPALNRLPLPEPQPLRGRIEADLDDLSGLQALVPALENTAGSLRADLQLAGTLQQPLLLGELVLADGAADVPSAGLELRQIELRIDGDPAQPGQLAIAGGLVSGPGRVDLSGRVDLAGGGVALAVTGDRLLAYNTPDARALVSPDLQLGWDSDVLNLRGRIEVPEADVTPQLGLSPALLTEDSAAAPQPGRVIAPSPDVVVIDAAGEVEEPPVSAPPLRLDSRLELVVGDRVNVSALGLIGRLTGKVMFINRPGADLLPVADGRLSIEDGTFRAFGQDLEIETGRVVFARKPVTEPELNVRAVRWIDNDPVVSSVGVLLSGPADQPLLELFSRPELDQTEIQSYLLTGSGSNNRDSVLSIGTYLYPKLYVSYGYNLLEETNQFDTLYTITPRYGVEAKVGEADNTLNMTITYEH